MGMPMLNTSMLRAPKCLPALVRGLAASVLAIAGSAQASVVYQFESANYGDADAPYTTSMHLSIQITLDDFLPASTATHDVNLLPGFELSWFDGIGAGSSSDPGFTVQTVDLTTDAGGNVLVWDFSFWNAIRYAAGNNIGGGGFIQVGVFSGDGNGFSQPAAGSWSVTQVAEELPEPGSIFLAGLGLLAAAAARRSALPRCA